MAAIDALQRILRAAQTVERLKSQLDQAEQELLAAAAQRQSALTKAQDIRAQIVLAKDAFAQVLENNLLELKGQ